MTLLAKFAAVLVGLFSLAMGLLAWISPAQIGTIVGLSAVGELGVHSLRGDVGAVFLSGWIGCGLALFMGKLDGLKIPIIVYGLVLIGRLISLPGSGVSQEVMMPIIIEVVLIALSLFAYKTLKKASV